MSLSMVILGGLIQINTSTVSSDAMMNKHEIERFMCKGRCCSLTWSQGQCCPLAHPGWPIAQAI